MRAYPIDPLGGTHSSIAWSGANNAGLVVGITQTSTPQLRADGWSCRAFFPARDATAYACVGFAWEWGRMHELPRLGGHNSFASSANNNRQVVGWSEIDQIDTSCNRAGQLGFHAVMWDLNDEETIELPPFGNDSASAATAISDDGHVVGISGNTGLVKHRGTFSPDEVADPDELLQQMPATCTGCARDRPRPLTPSGHGEPQALRVSAHQESPDASCHYGCPCDAPKQRLWSQRQPTHDL